MCDSIMMFRRANIGAEKEVNSFQLISLYFYNRIFNLLSITYIKRKYTNSPKLIFFFYTPAMREMTYKNIFLDRLKISEKTIIKKYIKLKEHFMPFEI